MSKSVKILNPVAGHGYTSRRNAEQYVAQSRARWADDTHRTIRFIESDHRHLDAWKKAHPPEFAAPVASARFEVAAWANVQIADSNMGQTFLRYPLADQRSGGRLEFAL